MRYRGALAVAVLVIGAGIGLAPLAATVATGAAGADPGTDAYAVAEASVLWDSPIERVAYLAYGVRERREDGAAPGCPDAGGRRLVTVVGAYTVFGVVASEVLVDCAGSTDRL